MKNLIRCIPVKFIAIIAVLEIFSAVAMPTLAFSYLTWAYSKLDVLAAEMRIEGYYKPAIDILDLAIRLKPNDALGHIQRGQIYGLLHDKDNGVQDEMKALSIANSDSPEDIEYRSLAHENLAGIYLNNKESLKAEAELKVALQLCPDSPLTAERLGTLMIIDKNTKEGLFYLATAKNSYAKLGHITDMKRVELKIIDLQKTVASLDRTIISCK